MDEQSTIDERVCSRHFPAGDATKKPQLNLGRKKSARREVRARRRDANRKHSEIMRSPTPSTSPSTSRCVTPLPITTPLSTRTPEPVLTVSTGEQLEQNYLVHKLHSESGDDSISDTMSSTLPSEVSATNTTEVTVNAALLAKIEALESEKSHLQTKLNSVEKTRENFRIECIQYDDNLVCFYTGFVSFAAFIALF